MEFLSGRVQGKYVIADRFGKPLGIPTPINFSGPGSNQTFSTSTTKLAIGPALSNWEGFDEKTNKPTWRGITIGLKAELSLPLFKKINLPLEISEVKTYTELVFPKLEKNSSTYNRLTGKPYYEEE